MRGTNPRALIAVAALVLGCRGAATPVSGASDSRLPGSTAAPATARRRARPTRTHVSEDEAQRPHPELPPDRRALMVVGPPGKGEERWVDADAAEGAGYTLLDLSDDWTPFIFAEQMSADGQPLPHRYRRIFLGLCDRETGHGA